MILELLSTVDLIIAPSLETVTIFSHPFLWADWQNLIPLCSDMGSIYHSAHDLQMDSHFSYLQLPNTFSGEHNSVGRFRWTIEERRYKWQGGCTLAGGSPNPK